MSSLQIHFPQHQSQIHKQHDFSRLAQQLESEIVKALTAVIVQQLTQALSNNKPQEPVQGPGGADGVGGQQGAGKGHGVQGLLQQFIEMLQMLEQMSNPGKKHQTNDLAQQFAGGLGGGGGQDTLDQLGQSQQERRVPQALPNAEGVPGGGGGANAGGTGGTKPDTDHGPTKPDTGHKPESVSSRPETKIEDTDTTPSATPVSGPPPIKGERVVNETIVVKAGETFDGKGMHFKAGPALGDGGATEGQKPVFRLEPGAKLKDVQISGADGVHVMGDATLKNVWWRDVGEDAMTKKGDGDVKVIGGGALNAHDKVFTVAAGGSLSVEGFTATNFGRLAATDHRFNKERNDGTFPLEVKISNSKLTNGDEVFRTDAANARVTFENVELNNVAYDARGPAGMEVIGGQKVGRVEGHVV